MQMILTYRKTFLLLALLLLSSGCHLAMHENIRGSGVREKQKREVASFTTIAMDGGAFDIDVVSQKPQSVEIEGDDNLLSLITTEVLNNVLHIKSKGNFSVNDPIKLRISVPNLEKLAIDGAGKIEVSGLKNDKFEINCDGASTIKVAGETRQLNIDTSGAGKIDARKLRATKGEVEARGVARVDVNVIEQLDVTVSGPSHVTYEGDPVVNKTIHGPGSVAKKENEGA